ncbi:MAG: uL15 family ribosomal protein, partial [Rhabdochlamydiaceae bacterium]
AKLLGQGIVHSALKVKVVRASRTAIEKIKAAGGSIEVLKESEPKEKEQEPTKATARGEPVETGKKKPVQKNKST